MTFTGSTTETWLARVEADCAITRVRVVSGPGTPGDHELATARAVIGTSDSADVRLADRKVSRFHCELVRVGSTVRLRDLQSKNGCWLAGQQVFDALLSAGAQIRVGNTVLELDVDRARLPIERWIGGDAFGPMIGHAESMHEVFAIAGRAALSHEPTLVRGESGTGKELLLRAIHELGPRADGPFVVLDCGALGTGFADVEIFGHARGAFTGASGDRMGVFERAAGGTLLLDHVDALPIEVQSKLLRVLDSGRVRRLGENVERRVDVRVVATAQVPLETAVNEGLFREDLFYRLAVFVIELPPLRERQGDVAAIARAMLAEIDGASPEDELAVERELARRAAYRWPGNARELRAFVRRVVWLGPELARLDAGGDGSAPEPEVDPNVPFHAAKQDVIERFERAYIARLLNDAEGNVAEAARRSGLNRTYLHRLVSKLGKPGPGDL